MRATSVSRLARVCKAGARRYEVVAARKQVALHSGRVGPLASFVQICEQQGLGMLCSMNAQALELQSRIAQNVAYGCREGEAMNTETLEQAALRRAAELDSGVADTVSAEEVSAAARKLWR
jgi:hypothetical protein